MRIRKNVLLFLTGFLFSFAGKAQPPAGLMKFFTAGQGERIDSTQQIPRKLVARYIKGPNFDTVNYVSEVNPIDLFQNRYGYFLLVKVNCSSGGACADFYLLVFNPQGQFVEERLIGSDTGEESFLNAFSYTRLSDTLVATRIIRYRDDNNTGDTVSKHTLHLQIPLARSK